MRFAFENNKRLKIAALILLGYLLTYGGYRIAIASFSPPAEALMLKYKKDLSAGSVAQPKDFIVVKSRVDGGFNEFVVPDERKLIQKVPLIRDVVSGGFVKKSDFLYFPGDAQESLPSHFGSLWIPNSNAKHSFSEGTTLELYGSSGKKIVGSALVLKSTDDSLLVALPKKKLPDVLRALGQGAVFPSITYGQEERKEKIPGFLRQNINWSAEVLLESSSRSQE